MTLKSTDTVNIHKGEDTPKLLGYNYRICIFARVGITSTNHSFAYFCGYIIVSQVEAMFGSGWSTQDFWAKLPIIPLHFPFEPVSMETLSKITTL